VKSTKPQAKEKERRETITPRNVYPVRSNLSYFGEEIDISNPLSMSSYKEMRKVYMKLVLTSSQRTNHNFYDFFNLTKEKETQ